LDLASWLFASPGNPDAVQPSPDHHAYRPSQASRPTSFHGQNRHFGLSFPPSNQTSQIPFILEGVSGALIWWISQRACMTSMPDSTSNTSGWRPSLNSIRNRGINFFPSHEAYLDRLA